MQGTGRLAGRVAVVTGGGKGIGAAYTRGLVREGARVAVLDIDGSAASDQADKLSADGGEARGWRVDVADPASVDTVVGEVASHFGRLDILINNAALFTAILPKRPFWEIDPNDWDRVMQVNTKGLFLCARAAFPFLKESGSGRVVNIASTTSLTGRTGMLHYVTSKGAVIAFTRSLARELGPYNITVNTLAPGLTASDSALGVYTAEEMDASAQLRAISRRQVPEDVVGAVLFLASDEAAFMTGQLLVVDGGVSMH